MKRRVVHVAAAVAALLASIASFSFAQGEKLDLAALAKIRDEGLNRSKVMETASWLSDVFGGRLTGSPSEKRAGDWTIKTLASWGIVNPRYERWATFGHSWENQGFTAQVVAPEFYPIVAYPTPWSFGTNGTVTGDVMIGVQIDSAPDFAKYKGRLRGRWILVGQPVPVNPKLAPIACRFDDAQLKVAVDLKRQTRCSIPADSQRANFERQAAAGPGAGRGGGRGGRGGAQGFQQQLTDFYVSEGVLGTLRGGSGTYTDFVVNVSGSRVAQVPTAGIANVVIAADHFGRIYRTAEKGVAVRVEINAKNRFTPDTGSFNIVGEIPGTDAALKDEVVVLGGHFDSWTAGTGGTDNTAGSAVMLEAMRILKTLGLPMKRTVRIGLWSGEEQGLIGSAQYVRAHYGYVDSLGQHFTSDHAKLAAYFNVDNGGGAIRGIYAEGNEGVVPVFNEWLAPLRDLGASIVTLAPTTGTDHQSFDRVGLPGFQFVQDELDYNSATHHTNADVYERLVPKDMIQNAVIVASFAFNAANRSDKLPRKAVTVGGRGRNH